MIPFFVFSQEYSYQSFLKNELSGLKIYDIVQDNNYKIWFATDNGIFVFDENKLKNVPINNSFGNSFFNLTKFNDGIVFNNLSGQIFFVHNDSSSIIYQIPDSLITNQILMFTDNNNHLIINTKAIIKINLNLDSDIIYVSNSNISTEVNEENNLVFFDTQTSRLTEIDIKSKMKKYLSKKLHLNYFSFYQNYRYNKHLFFDPNTCKVNFLENDTLKEWIQSKNKVGRIYYFENKIIIAYNTQGISVYDLENNKIKRHRNMFENYFISGVYEDKEGNFWFTTFDFGVLLVRNVKVNNLLINAEIGKILQIETDNKGEIFITTSKGEIYTFDKINKPFTETNKSKSIELLAVYENDLIWEDGKLNIKNIDNNSISSIKIGSVKSCQKIGKDDFLIATNFEVSFISRKKNLLAISKRVYKGRCYFAIYDSVSNTTFFSTPKGLFKHKNGSTNEILYKNNRILAVHLALFKEKLLIGTKGNGLLVHENGTISRVHKNSFNNVNSVLITENKIIVTTENGLFFLDFKMNIFYVMNVSEGLNSNNILDVAYFNDTLYVCSHFGVQYFEINNLSKNGFKPIVSIKSIFVNGKKIESQNIETQENSNVRIVFDVNTFKYKDEINSAYLLSPLDSAFNKVENYRIEFKSLPANNYVLTTKSNFRNAKYNKSNISIIVNKPFYKGVWFIVIVLTIVSLSVLISIVIVNKRRIAYMKKENEVINSKLTAIKSQMNPHFIFNALNSIQDLVLQGDIENSYTYITKFANLVRKTLNYSDKDFIPFEDEVKLIELYLNIEKLRFKAAFNYEIHTNKIDDIEVPPLLIQPFIENALVHGLLHKEGLKTLKISFYLKECLICEIEDNGIGRAASARIKARNNYKNNSFSVNAIENRLNLMKSKFGTSLGVFYEDLLIDELPIGTKVVLKIPFISKF